MRLNTDAPNLTPAHGLIVSIGVQNKDPVFGVIGIQLAQHGEGGATANGYRFPPSLVDI
jgi:hypothetical protein